MKYRFQHFIDISTSASSMQSITFSVGGNDVIKRCAHLFNAYKYFKLGKITVKFVPASTLPVDPLGMSYADTDPQTVDPRDQLNPGLVRIVNGEDVFTDVSGIGTDAQMAMYESMLLDPRWYKFNLQSGFKRSAYPLFWEIGQLHQDQWPGSSINVPGSQLNSAGTGISGRLTTNNYQMNSVYDGSDGEGTTTDPNFYYQNNFSDEKGLFQIGHRGRIGWLPTDAFQKVYNGTASGTLAAVHAVPQVKVIQCFLPKAYKTLYYYRVYITEEVSFSGLKSIAPDSEITGTSLNYRPADIFISPPSVNVAPPFTGVGINPGLSIATAQNNDGAGRD